MTHHLAARALALGLLVLGLAAVPAPASAPPGPRLLSAELIETKGSEREEDASPPFVALTSFGESGGQQRHLLRGKLESGSGVIPSLFFRPTWSADGSLVAFVGIGGGKSGVYVADADGSNVHLVRGTSRGTDPVLAPDGKTIAFSRSKSHLPKPTKHGSSGRYFSSTTTWLVDVASGKAQRLTAWRNGFSNVPGSFSPDGSQLALSRNDDKLGGPSVVLMHLDGSGESTLAPLAEEPVISPDGTRVAFVGYRDATHVEAEENRDYDIGELYAMNVDGTGLTRLTRNKDRIETSPSWDPSGQRIAYVEVTADTSFDPGLALLFPTGNAVEEVNADGSCRKKIRSSPKVAFYGVAWQPGAEHAAGRIGC